MIVMTATEFKAKCLEVLRTVKRTGEPVRITNRGEVVAEVNAVGVPEVRKYAEPGFLIGKMEIIGDIEAPLDVEWEAMKGLIDGK